MDKKFVEKLVKDLIAACNLHEVDRISRFFSDDFVGRDVTYAKTLNGKNELLQSLREYLAAFGDVTLKSENLLFDGDQIMVLWTATGIHSGNILKIPPSFRHYSVQGVWIMEIRDDQIIKGTGIWDLSGFLRRIRLMPNLPHEKHSTSLN